MAGKIGTLSEQRDVGAKNELNYIKVLWCPAGQVRLQAGTHPEGSMVFCGIAGSRFAKDWERYPANCPLMHPPAHPSMTL